MSVKLPQLNYKQDGVSMINQFLGLNRNIVAQENEFAKMKNMTNDYFPVLTNRKKRGFIRKLDKPQGILGGRYLSYVDDNKLYYDEGYVCDLDNTDAERKLIQMGAYLCVFPDGIIYNTYSNEIKTIKNETTADNVTISLCKLDGTRYDSNNTVVGNTAPSDHSKYWLDTSQETVVMKMFSSTTSMWVSVPTVYCKFEAPNIGKGFHPYDAVTFEGVDRGGWVFNNYDFNTSNIIYACDDNALVVIGLINLNHVNSNPITFKRELPEMEYICENTNRLWGCSSDKHEIYACKQGDPTNWNFYAGLDNDSYAATVGTQNVFTGCAAHGGYVYFFKEDGYHKIYGTKPSNFEMVWKPSRGVQLGSGRSVSTTGDYMFYKSTDGVCIFDGNPTVISNNLGIYNYYDAVGCGYKDKYYVSMRDEDYVWTLYIYDTKKRTWTAEDDIRVKYMTVTNKGMYFITNENDLYAVNNESIFTKVFPSQTEHGDTFIYPNEAFYPGNSIGGEMEDTIEWMFETVDMGMGSPYHKYIKRINVRIEMDVLSKLKMEIMYDSSDSWLPVVEYCCTKKRSFEIPIPIQRCDHFRIRFSGWGEFKLYSIAQIREEGSGT